MKSTFLKYLTLAAVAGMVTERASAAISVPVGMELALLVDVSGSVDNAEFLIQRNGYVAAFQSVAIQNAITTLASQNGGNGLAVSYTQWSTGQQLSVGWTLLNNAADANAFANLILNAARPSQSNTAPGIGAQTGVGDAIIFGTNSMNGNLFDGGRQVIDVSGDGVNNVGVDAAVGRNFASANGVDKINGLPIGDAALTAYYVNNVQFGTGSFTLPADSFNDFAPAVERKILAEITNTNPPGRVPEGGPGLVMSAILLSGLAGLRMKFRATSRA